MADSCFNSDSRKSKQTLNVFDIWYKINSKNIQAKIIFYLKSKLNHVFVIALPNCQLLHQVSEKAIPHPIIYSYLENYSRRIFAELQANRYWLKTKNIFTRISLTIKIWFRLDLNIYNRMRHFSDAKFELFFWICFSSDCSEIWYPPLLTCLPSGDGTFVPEI